MNKFPKKKHTQVFLQKNCVQRVKKSSFRHSVRLLRRCLNFFFFQASPDATVPVSPFAPINSPPDCFLNAAHPLRVRIPPPNSIKNIPAAAEMLFFGPLGGIRTPDLQNRNLLRYPAAPRADIYETAERNVVGSAFFFIT